MTRTIPMPDGPVTFLSWRPYSYIDQTLFGGLLCVRWMAAKIDRFRQSLYKD